VWEEIKADNQADAVKWVARSVDRELAEDCVWFGDIYEGEGS